MAVAAAEFLEVGTEELSALLKPEKDIIVKAVTDKLENVIESTSNSVKHLFKQMLKPKDPEKKGGSAGDNYCLWAAVALVIVLMILMTTNCGSYIIYGILLLICGILGYAIYKKVLN